ncbi:MAG: autoinducer binding domain-containing protein [Yoonia sp.]|uniref:autoinducer binding domain-containing protein n=1 Tax=Yoonia sp. TaxID=2212373 RepID=UPI00220F2130|nr:LuxR family transcriptional regulator [Rhodobacteraceae bacterium S2214]
MSQTIAKLYELTNAKTVEELWEIHTKHMAAYGFKRLIYAFTRYYSSSAKVAIGDPQDWVLLTNLSSSYVDKFVEDGHYFHGPMIQWALRNDGACSWRWMKEMIGTDLESQKEHEVIEFNKSYGIATGYTLSFRSVSQRSKGAIALIGDEGMSQDKVDQIWAQHGDELMVLNNVMHLKILALPHSGSRKLTTRQREVLQWVGDGKTTQDIAILLGLTAATVEKHLRLARESLDVETTAQAVLKAAFYNQMFVLDN